MVINYSCYYILIHNCRGIWWRSGQRGTTSEYNQSTCIRRIDVNTVMEGSLGSITGQCKKKKKHQKDCYNARGMGKCCFFVVN